MYLKTYNAIDGKKDLMTSHDFFSHNFSNERCLNYVSSDILPISHWKLTYGGPILGTQSGYKIQTSKEIPSSIEIKRLSGHKITKSGNQFNFTHSNIFPDKNLARSTIRFQTSNYSQYSLHFDGSETIGNTTISPFEIPYGTLEKNTILLEGDSLEWFEWGYSHTYTNIPNNSPLDYLKNSKLRRIENTSSTTDFTYEVYSIYW